MTEHHQTHFSIALSKENPSSAVLMWVIFVFFSIAIISISSITLAADADDGYLQMYYGNKSDESFLCRNPDVDGSCICTEQTSGIYQERCVSIPNAFSSTGTPNTSRYSSSFVYPRVRFASYKPFNFIFPRQVAYLGPGECEWIHAWRHCARLTYGNKAVGEEGYDPSKNYGNDLRGDTSGLSETGIPLRLCVFKDNWDFKDTNGAFSPFHVNTPFEEAQQIKSQMEANSWGGIEWLGSGDREVSGWDDFWSLLTGGSYNNSVSTIVGCAPIPLAPMPPPFCDTCSVLPNVPDPLAELAEGSTFEESELKVVLKSYRYNVSKGINEVYVDGQEDVTNLLGFNVTLRGDSTRAECVTTITNGKQCADENNRTVNIELFPGECITTEEGGRQCGKNKNTLFNARLPIGSCVTHEGKEYCANYCAEGKEICFFENESENPRVIKYINRPGFMPLPIIEDVTTDGNSPQMKVYFGMDPAQLSETGKTYAEQVKDGSSDYTKTAVLTANDGDNSKVTLHGVEFRLQRDCIKRNEDDPAICEELSPEVCLMGYNPQPFDEPGYHPSKGVLVDLGTNEYASLQYNSQQGDKIYFDSKQFFTSEANASLPSNLMHRPFTPSELELCIGGQWRWPTAVNSIHTIPGTHTVDVDPTCSEIEIEMWGAGAAGRRTSGCNDTSCDYSGGAGAYTKARLTLDADDEISVVIGAGGTNHGSNGGATSFKRNGGTLLLTGGANKSVGGVPIPLPAMGVLIAQGKAQLLSVRVGGNGALASSGHSGTSGGLAFNSSRHAGSSCTGRAGSVGRAPMASGGCAMDDNPGSGSYGQGGHGGMSMVCTKFGGFEE